MIMYIKLEVFPKKLVALSSWTSWMVLKDRVLWYKLWFKLRCDRRKSKRAERILSEPLVADSGDGPEAAVVRWGWATAAVEASVILCHMPYRDRSKSGNSILIILIFSASIPQAPVGLTYRCEDSWIRILFLWDKQVSKFVSLYLDMKIDHELDYYIMQVLFLYKITKDNEINLYFELVKICWAKSN